MEIELQKRLYINELFDFYGELLSARQKEIIIAYYEENLSLSEIAENESISRNAVYDALKKAEEALIGYENKLHLYANRKNYLKKIEELKEKHLISEDVYIVLKGE